jgi:hypothetical protein
VLSGITIIFLASFQLAHQGEREMDEERCCDTGHLNNEDNNWEVGGDCVIGFHLDIKLAWPSGLDGWEAAWGLQWFQT